MHRVRERSPTPVAIDEGSFTAADLARTAELNGPELLADLFVEGLEITGAVATVPTTPGLGVQVDEDQIRSTAARSLMVTAGGSGRVGG